MSEEELIVSRYGRLGSIRLNRPAALNSLTLGMVRLFTRALAPDNQVAVLKPLCAHRPMRLLATMSRMISLVPSRI